MKRRIRISSREYLVCKHCEETVGSGARSHCRDNDALESRYEATDVDTGEELFLNENEIAACVDVDE